MDTAIADYICIAKRKRAARVERGRGRKTRKANIDQDIEEQMMVISTSNSDNCNGHSHFFLFIVHVQIHVGKMIHSDRKKKGVFVPHDTPVQIMLRKNCSYEHMVERCRMAIYPNEEESAKYYVANSTGACIASGHTITLDRSDGTVDAVPWTLETYLKCSKKKYASRARFYCVKRISG